MLYRFDEQWCGQVIAEARQEGLEPWLGLYYPESDIPVQARELYRVSRMRVLANVDGEPVRLLSAPTILGEGPLDLTYSVLRAMSPSHLTYLRQMGVKSCMSMSLMRDEHLWGLMLCHHYDQAITPDLAQRSTAQFLCSVMSVRLLHAQARQDAARRERAKAALQELKAALHTTKGGLAAALTSEQGQRGLIDSDGLLIKLDHQGEVEHEPAPRNAHEAVGQWISLQAQRISHTTALTQEMPHVSGGVEGVSGVLGLPLPNGQFVAWVRREHPQVVRWGGDPNKTDVGFNDEGLVIVTPRTEFTPYEEHITGHALPWTEDELAMAEQVRMELLDALYQRSQPEIRTAQAMREALIPSVLPQPSGWSVQAHAQPAPEGALGGDWFHVVHLRDGSFSMMIGDIGGHGLSTAGAMTQMRGAMHAIVMGKPDPSQALAELDQLVAWSMPDTLATALVLRLHPYTGNVQIASAGHHAPLLVTRDTQARVCCQEVTLTPGALLGLETSQFPLCTLTLNPGERLVLFTDGVVENRTEALDVGIRRLSNHLVSAIARLTGEANLDLASIMATVRPATSTDDASLVVLTYTGATPPPVEGQPNAVLTVNTPTAQPT